jgi:hypothetical protein
MIVFRWSWELHIYQAPVRCGMVNGIATSLAIEDLRPVLRRRSKSNFLSIYMSLLKNSVVS